MVKNLLQVFKNLHVCGSPHSSDGRASNCWRRGQGIDAGFGPFLDSFSDAWLKKRMKRKENKNKNKKELKWIDLNICSFEEWNWKCSRRTQKCSLKSYQIFSCSVVILLTNVYKYVKITLISFAYGSAGRGTSLYKGFFLRARVRIPIRG